MQNLAFSHITIKPSARTPPVSNNPPKKHAGFLRRRLLPPISAVAQPPAPLRYQTCTKQYPMPPEKVEVFKSLECWASHRILPLLKPVENLGNPLISSRTRLKISTTLPMKMKLRERTSQLPDDYFVVLVGDMITEEALPTYQSMLNRNDGIRDDTGASPSPWATWIRSWTAEENRHGDLLRTYLYLSGRVDMQMIDRTIQFLISSGMDPGVNKNPYLGFAYTSFQERATFLSHANTARLAKEGGDPVLARICGTIASDEKRHENAYSLVFEKLLEVDPNGAMLAIGDMMRKNIKMPAHLMYDGQDPNCSSTSPPSLNVSGFTQPVTILISLSF